MITMITIAQLNKRKISFHYKVKAVRGATSALSGGDERSGTACLYKRPSCSFAGKRQLARSQTVTESLQK